MEGNRKETDDNRKETEGKKNVICEESGKKLDKNIKKNPRHK